MVAAMTYGERIRVRREELKLTQQQIAEAVGVSYQTVQQWESGATAPKRENRKMLAKALRTSEVALEFGGVQEKMPLTDYNTEEGPPIARLAPLISWIQAGSFREAADPYVVGQAEDWYPMPRKAGPRTFALRIRGVSMEPRYREGEIIFVDPDAEPRHGSRVVVRLESEKEVTFKELVIEGERKYLKALNPAWPDPLIRIEGDATICGVVIGKWVPE